MTLLKRKQKERNLIWILSYRWKIKNQAMKTSENASGEAFGRGTRAFQNCNRSFSRRKLRGFGGRIYRQKITAVYHGESGEVESLSVSYDEIDGLSIKRMYGNAFLLAIMKSGKKQSLQELHMRLRRFSMRRCFLPIKL